ncbi:MAG: hypothetical protein JEY91_14555 [Spirochaetaceae bacterium]|nr:hypothetical protein [Spirochaetaceae bacterium]
MAQSQFEVSRPFYIFSDDGKSIIMNPKWMLYFYENQTVLRSFISWNWLDYMQRRNPSVPNLQLKLFPPSVRNSLNNQTTYWNRIIEKEKLSCIFSGRPIMSEDLSIDHFLPWSFVAHDQLWNLIPVSRSINSSKSNNLPDLERYFDKFVDMQFRGLQIYKKNPGKVSWNRIVEPYVADLRLKPEDLMDRGKLKMGLRNTIEPLSCLAVAQGFYEGWVYG